MEFVDRYGQMDPIPLQIKLGERITIRGQIAGGASLQAISIARTESPKPMSREELLKTKSYHLPQPYSYMPVRSDAFTRTGKTWPDGRFEIELSLSDESRPGVYFVTVWVRDVDGKPVAASQRAVLAN